MEKIHVFSISMAVLGISISLGNTLHFIPIQWYFELSISILSSKIPINILSPYQSCKGDLLLRSVQGNQIEIHTLVEKPKLLKFLKQFNTYFDKDMTISALHPLKSLNASHTEFTIVTNKLTG